jgi:acyl-CoA thioester hydrolase
MVSLDRYNHNIKSDMDDPTMPPFKFSIPLTVRMGEINYRNHVAHHNYLLYFQEARIAYLNKLGCSERDIYGVGMVISEATCSYKRQLFLGEGLQVYCGIQKLEPKMFQMGYQIEKDGVVCGVGATINHCYDYQIEKVVPLPDAFVDAIRGYEPELF